uniref:LBH domain-containing protein n=1 Tax=Amphiprion ocellaris TaxID=80972 RepID=A0AAQ5WYQ6_AMPOC
RQTSTVTFTPTDNLESSVILTNMNEESDYPEDFLYRRERLPSIVVEPTEHSEHESGELCCPPRCQINKNVEEDEEEDKIFCDSLNSHNFVCLLT